MVKKKYPKELMQYKRSHIVPPVIIMVLIMISVVAVEVFTETYVSLAIGIFALLAGMIIMLTATAIWASILPMFERTELILERIARLESMLEKRNVSDGKETASSDNVEPGNRD